MLRIDPDTAHIHPDPIPEAPPQQPVRGNPQAFPGRIVERHVHPAEPVDRHPPSVVQTSAHRVHPLPNLLDVQHFLADHRALQTLVDYIPGGQHPSPGAIRHETLTDPLDSIIRLHPHQHPATVRILGRFQHLRDYIDDLHLISDLLQLSVPRTDPPTNSAITAFTPNNQRSCSSTRLTRMHRLPFSASPSSASSSSGSTGPVTISALRSMTRSKIGITSAASGPPG